MPRPMSPIGRELFAGIAAMNEAYARVIEEHGPLLGPAHELSYNAQVILDNEMRELGYSLGQRIEAITLANEALAANDH